MFWCFTGILTSLIAIQIEEPPLKTLDDLNSKSNFKIWLTKGSTFQRVEEWANQTQKPENRKSFERSIISLPTITKKHYQEVAKNPNVAVIREDVTIKSFLEKCKINDIIVESFYSVKYRSLIITSNVCQKISVMKTKTLVFPEK